MVSLQCSFNKFSKVYCLQQFALYSRNSHRKNHSLKDQAILRMRNVTIINDFTQNALRHNHYWMSNWNYRSYDILSSLKPRKNTFGYKNWRFQTCLIGNDSISLDFAISENYDIYVHTLYKYPCNLKKLRPQ